MYHHALECTGIRDPYQVLGMPRSATADDIRRSFRRLAKTLHPDVNRSDPEAAARFAELNSAHEILSNRAKRGAFDRGEIDARGRPARRASATRRSRARSTVRHIVMCLAIAVPIFSVTSTLIARNLTASGVVITNGDRKGSLLSRFGISDAQSSVGAGGAARMVVATRTSTDRNFAAGAFAVQFERQRIAFLVNRGEELIAQGDIAAARILLQRAAEARDARAAFALAATYDPIMLAILRAHGVTADVALARDWYQKAGEFGSDEAQYRLDVLAALH
jgi:hypothetical protein